MFNKELIQAISDWQRGGNAKQKSQRAAVLKCEALTLPERYKNASTTCYRQISLTAPFIMNIGTSCRLPEAISSWTKNEKVARGFKGGVPPPGDYLGVIFSITPATEITILDITALFADPDFVTAVGRHRNNIADFDSGMGRYGNSQEEVVLEVTELPLEAIHAWGGYSSNEQRLAQMLFGQTISQKQFEKFRVLMVQSGHQAGPYWVSEPNAVGRISAKLKYDANRLSNRRMR